VSICKHLYDEIVVLVYGVMDTHHESRVVAIYGYFFSISSDQHGAVYICWQLVTVGNARIRCTAWMTTHRDQYFDEYMVPSIASFL
jgi:hypothetical protein